MKYEVAGEGADRNGGLCGNRHGGRFGRDRGVGRADIVDPAGGIGMDGGQIGFGKMETGKPSDRAVSGLNRQRFQLGSKVTGRQLVDLLGSADRKAVGRCSGGGHPSQSQEGNQPGESKWLSGFHSQNSGMGLWSSG